MERKDSWTPEDDATLAEIVIRHVREGSTQLKAFEEASVRLIRTASACGFRWNSEVRKEYENELRAAKEYRKLNKESNSKSITMIYTPSETMDDTDPFEALEKALDNAKMAYKRLQREYENLRRENLKLEKKLEEKPQGEDLQNLMKLLNHARKLGLLDKSESPAV